MYLHVSDIVLNNTSIGAEHLHNFFEKLNEELIIYYNITCFKRKRIMSI